MNNIETFQTKNFYSYYFNNQNQQPNQIEPLEYYTPSTSLSFDYRPTPSNDNEISLIEELIATAKSQNIKLHLEPDKVIKAIDSSPEPLRQKILQSIFLDKLIATEFSIDKIVETVINSFDDPTKISHAYANTYRRSNCFQNDADDIRKEIDKIINYYVSKCKIEARTRIQQESEYINKKQSELKTVETLYQVLNEDAIAAHVEGLIPSSLISDDTRLSIKNLIDRLSEFRDSVKGTVLEELLEANPLLTLEQYINQSEWKDVDDTSSYFQNTAGINFYSVCNITKRTKPGRITYVERRPYIKIKDTSDRIIVVPLKDLLAMGYTCPQLKLMFRNHRTPLHPSLPVKYIDPPTGNFVPIKSNSYFTYLQNLQLLPLPGFEHSDNTPLYQYLQSTYKSQNKNFSNLIQEIIDSLNSLS